MEVSVQSLLPEGQPQGCFRLQVEPTQTVEDLLRLVCEKARIPLSNTYCLRNSRGMVLNRAQTMTEAEVSEGNVLNWSDEGIHYESGRSICSFWWILCLISLSIGAVGLVAISIIKSQEDFSVYGYGIVFDAGSSHTSMYVYYWDGLKLNNSAVASQFKDDCSAGSLTSFAENPQGLVSGFDACLQLAQSRIPESQHKTTPVYLGATAGMRMLNEVNQSVSDAILDEVRKVISNYPFNFTDPKLQARIISGEEEGVSSWITSNYIAGAFQTGIVEPPPPRFGALDLGGASTQISFMTSSDLAAGYQFDLQLYGRNYSLYTHSYLCYGVNEVIRRLKAALVVDQNATVVKNPCGHIGQDLIDTVADVFLAPCVSGLHAVNTFGSTLDKPLHIPEDSNLTFVGTANNQECVSLVRSLFNFTAPCNYSHCSFNGVFQPPVTGEFYAFSSYFYISKFLNLTGNFTLKQFSNSINVFCNKTWAEVREIPSDQPSAKAVYCMQAHYIHALLTMGYNFTDANWNLLDFVGQIRGTSIGWTLGYMIYQSSYLPPEQAPAGMSMSLFVALLILFSIFLLMSIAFAMHARRYQNALQKEDYERLSSYGTI